VEAVRDRQDKKSYSKMERDIKVEHRAVELHLRTATDDDS
jgi:hypothetical protein